MISMDESGLSGYQRRVKRTPTPTRPRPQDAPSGSFDVLVAYDSDIQRQGSPPVCRPNRGSETLRELAGLAEIGSASDPLRPDYEEVPLLPPPPGRVAVPDIHEVPVRDVSSGGAVTQRRPPAESRQRFDLFSSASLPSSPDRSGEPIARGDRNSARYLRILVPQQDTGARAVPPADDVSPAGQPGFAVSRSTSLNHSEGELFESLPSTAENLLLESPTDSPARFSQLRLTLNSVESEGDTLTSLEESLAGEPHLSSFLRQQSKPQPPQQQQQQQQQSRPLKVAGRGPGSEKDRSPFLLPPETDLEKELKRLVVEIYSEKATEFVPIAGLFGSHPAKPVTQQGLQCASMGDSHPMFVQYEGITSPAVAYDSPDVTATGIGDAEGNKADLAGPSYNALSNLTSTADALALQRSVIGSSPTKPASMEEISAAIAAAEKQYRQRLQHCKQQQQPQQSASQAAEHIPNGSPGFALDNLDERPTRLPASPPQLSADNDDEKIQPEASLPAAPSAADAGPDVTAARTKSPAPPPPASSSTPRVRPGSLVVQNTGLAISSAVGSRFGASPANADFPPPGGSETAAAAGAGGGKERVLYRSPVQAITTSRGGRTVAVHTPDTPQRPDGQGPGGPAPAKRADQRVYASPAAIKASIASQASSSAVDRKPAAGKAPQSFVAVTAAEDHFQVREVGLGPDTDVIVTRDPQNAGPGSHLIGEEPSTSGRPADAQAQVAGGAPAPGMNTDDKPKPSFLGSFFQWGKKPDAEPQPAGVSTPDPSSPVAIAPTSLGQQSVAESQDSGIDLVPAGGGAGVAEAFHADFEPVHADFEPVHASTPLKGRRGRDDPDGRREPRAPDTADGRYLESHADPAQSVDNTDARIQEDPPRASTREASHQHQQEQQQQQQQQPVARINAHRAGKQHAVRANHVGTGPPALASVRRRDMHKMPSTSLTSVYGSLKAAATPRYGASATPTSTSGEPADLESALREKANLEGRLETLAVETEAALQQRAEMQTQVAGLQAQLKAHGSAAEAAQQRAEAAAADLALAQQSHGQLEAAVAALQAGLERKEEDAGRLRRELQSAEAGSQRLRDKVEEGRAAAASREAGAAALRDRLAGVQQEAEAAHQERTQLLAELAALRGDVESLGEAKEWFQDQLRSAQEARGRLQRELTETQALATRHGAAAEGLRADRAQLQHQLAETRQQALQEKELIAKHLETIEADFLAREAAFQDLQKEKAAVQEAVASRMDQMNQERSKLSDLIASCVELERQLDRTQKELADKQADVASLYAEKKDLVKRLALAEESLVARDKELEALQEKCTEAGAKVRELESEAAEQTGELQSQRAEKSSLEAALATANGEKRAFDEALQSLRQDMGKVEAGFQQMKRELGQRDDRLGELQAEREELRGRLVGAEAELAEHRQSVEGLRDGLSGQEGLVAELTRVRAGLEAEVAGLGRELEEARRAGRRAETAGEALRRELAASRQAAGELEGRLEEALTESAHLEGQLEMMADEQQRFAGLLEANASLKQRLAEAQSAAHRELADQRATALRLGSDLATAQRQLREGQRSQEAAAAALAKRLKEATAARQAAEAEVEALRQSQLASNKEIQGQLARQLDAAKKELDAANRDREDLERQLEALKRRIEQETAEYKDRLAELEDQLQNLKEVCEQQQRNEEASRRLALDLERERGRLAGVQQSHSALKQHASLLEAALGRRETALAEVSAQMAASEQEHAAADDQLRAKLREESQAHKKLKESHGSLLRKMAAGKAEIGRLQRDLQEQGSVLEDARSLQDRRAEETRALQQELDRAMQSGEEQKGKTQEVAGQLEEVKGQLGQLRRQLQEKHSRDPVVAEQIKALEWESEQRTLEADALKEQLELAEHRQKIEMDNAQATIQMGRRELESLKAELAATRKEKFAYQGKLSQFKSALKATLQQNKLLKAKLRSKQKERTAPSNSKMAAGGGVVASGDVAVVPDDIIVPEISVDVETLLNSDDKAGITESSSKPLTALRGCLQSVRDQMGGLQQQMDEHTSAVNSSSKAWKDVEFKVRDLRQSCMTPLEGSTTPPESAATSSAADGGIAPPTSRRSLPTSPPASGQSPRTTPASMAFASLPKVYDI